MVSHNLLSSLSCSEKRRCTYVYVVINFAIYVVFTHLVIYVRVSDQYWNIFNNLSEKKFLQFCVKWVSNVNQTHFFDLIFFLREMRMILRRLMMIFTKSMRKSWLKTWVLNCSLFFFFGCQIYFNNFSLILLNFSIFSWRKYSNNVSVNNVHQNLVS